ncbi:MAG: hypothetical protein ACLFPE_15425, partial [Bacteroidales bacterium]
MLITPRKLCIIKSQHENDDEVKLRAQRKLREANYAKQITRSKSRKANDLFKHKTQSSKIKTNSAIGIPIGKNSKSKCSKLPGSYASLSLSMKMTTKS